MGEKEHQIEMKSGEFVRLCFRCHKAVHWCMKYLGLSWEQIVGLYANGKLRPLQG